MTEYTIYAHFLPNGKVYVGQTSVIPEQRWKNGKGYRSNKLFYNDIKYYGWNNIEHRIIEEHLPSDQADQAEQYYISLYDSHNPKNGYNQNYGGKINPKINWTYYKIRKAKLNKLLKSKKQKTKNK